MLELFNVISVVVYPLLRDDVGKDALSLATLTHQDADGSVTLLLWQLVSCKDAVAT